ncbi:DMSO/TMAO reductase YedYZ, heme-binding membrane subunit [Ruminococcus flavefaciens]|uniref:DMSO/TMAO reductase YedYZ, heme-binding membrane subunit n=2 Tax=Ruminococcus flavefaciens TaxID=1265 RepID=A0A1M7JMB1_RUMFL|nr:DMSO/TMAO reductase YedYZ, heme-binding membrane subunit [Ruminococcus flavefaciens]
MYMLFIISLIIALFTAFILDKPLKKCPAAFYISAALLTAASIYVSQSDISITNRIVRDYVLGIFSRGALGAAFWAVVMWTGALPNGSAPIKKLMTIRGELSITAAFLTFSHIVTFGLQYVRNLINGRTGSGDAYRDFVVTCILSLLMTFIMVPLTVMSFKTVRKKMNAKTWKNIQRLAYLFYAMIYIHIMLLFVPKAQRGREGYFLSVLVYSAVFIGYAVLRFRKYYLSKKEKTSRLIPNTVCACAFIIPLCLSGIVSRNTNTKTRVTSTAPKAAVEASVSEQTQTATTAVTTSDGTKTTTAVRTSTTAVSTADKDTKTTEAAADEKAEEVTEAENTEEQPEEAQPEETQQTFKYKNGTFEGTGEGYNGKVHVSITIENDTITAFSASADDDDPDFFDDAKSTVIPQIKNSLSADGIDACSGATYSSKGIIEAAKNALEQALN